MPPSLACGSSDRGLSRQPARSGRAADAGSSRPARQRGPAGVWHRLAWRDDRQGRDRRIGDRTERAGREPVTKPTAAREYAKERVLSEYLLLPPDEARPAVAARSHPSWAEAGAGQRERMRKVPGRACGQPLAVAGRILWPHAGTPAAIPAQLRGDSRTWPASRS